MPQPGTNFPAIPRNQKVVFVVDHTLESRNLLDTSPSGEDILTSYKAAITGTLDEVLARGSEIALISYWGGIDTEIGFTQSKTAFLSELNSIAPQGAVGVWYATLGGAMTHVAAFLDASSVTEDDDVTIVWFSCGAETHITQFADAFDSAKATWPFLKVMWLRTITAGYGGIYDQVRHRVTIPTFTTDYDETLAWALDATLPPSSADYGAEDPDTVPVGKSYVDATGVLGPLTPPEAFIKTSVPGTGLTGIVVPVSNVATDEPDPSPEELIIWQATRFECRITDFSGAYSYGVPTGHVISADWQTERYGGYANFNLTVAEHGVGDDVDLSNLPAFARVEFWIDGVCRYRGFVTKPVVSLANPRQYQLSGFGLFVIAGDSTVRRNFVYGQFKDIAKIFSDLAHDALENRHEGLQIESHTIGMTRQTANYRGKSLKDAVDAMVTESGNAAAWGFYVKEVDYTEISRPGVERSYALFYRPNSLEFYPITSLDSPDHSLIVPSSVANGAQGEQDWTRVINLVTLNGGTRTNPNLVYNANFSKLVNAGAGVLNLIPNADFEDGGTGWGGGGSLKEAGGQEGNPFSGSKMWEIDRENEALERTLTGLTLTTDEQYRFAFRYRNENQSAYRNLEITLNWHYDNGSESSGVVDQFLTADKGYWVLWEVPLTVPTPPVGRTITGIHFKIRMHSVASNGTGVLLDAIEFHSMTALAQDGWEAIQNGTSRIKSQQWDYRDSPGIDDSGYCLAITVTSSDNNANCVAVRMTP